MDKIEKPKVKCRMCIQLIKAFIPYLKPDNTIEKSINYYCGDGRKFHKIEDIDAEIDCSFHKSGRVDR